MLKLKKISKSYHVGDFSQRALDEVTVDFRKNEFVAVLGPSGCGKTTLLNIIGGLDKYDSGDLEILGKSTKNFQDQEWDMYRNNTIGFIFQSHNLISHLSILQNVELGLALSGIAMEERHRRAKEVLTQVGLADHIGKRPNQLSGGQAQRVAIARALATNPDIVLADEPTGSLDSATSVQIMDLIRTIAQDKLVIMVTHNQELAARYATRIIRLKDGKITDDTNPVKEAQELTSDFHLKKTAMSFATALVSSLNNIKTKLGRTLLTAFAGSIGIIGIALIQSLSTGMDLQIANFEQDAIAEFPIVVTDMRFDLDSFQEMMEEDSGIPEYPDTDYASVYLSANLLRFARPNIITDDYIDWVHDYAEGEGADLITGLMFDRYMDLTFFRVDGADEYTSVYHEDSEDGPDGSGGFSLSFFNRLPEGSLLESTYDLLYGTFPESEAASGSFEVVLLVDQYNRIYDLTLQRLGYSNISEDDTFAFSDLIGKEFQLFVGDYVAGVSDMEEALDVTISGIVRLKEDSSSGLFYNGLGVPAEVFTAIETNHPEAVGAEIQAIYIYAKDFAAKESVKAYLDYYNEFHGYGDDSAAQIEYIDRAAMITSMAKNVLDTISIVLIAFAAISLVVSSIMIAIITYISVIERTKEIGVLRALGARKKDVARVFNSENLLIGFGAGVVGIGVAYLLTIPANLIIEYYSEVPNVAQLRFTDAAILVGVSVFLAFLAGFVPARIASKKDPVIALRTE